MKLRKFLCAPRLNTAAQRTPRHRTPHVASATGALWITLMALLFSLTPMGAEAQSYRFSNVAVEGNQRIETGTIVTYAGIARGETVTAGQLNEAYQRVLGSGLFEEVTINPRGS